MAHWKKGKGWGWIWGETDEIGALNAITPASVLAAMSLVKQGKVCDLGVMVDRNSFRWPGHSSTEVMAYRTPDGQRVKEERIPGANDPHWQSTAFFICDNIGTHLDGLSHITIGEGADTHWYNGFKLRQHATDFGVLRAGADKFPPIVARGVLLDVAAYNNLDALPGGYSISATELASIAEKAKVELKAGDVVLIRTGTGRFWGDTGADHESLARHDSAGITMDAARWLVEECGAMMIGSDTSACERTPFEESVHVYLLVQQGVPIGELHYLEELSRSAVYEFAYIAATNKIKGASAGTAMRPFAIY